MTNIYIGQYKNGRRFNRFNIIRYTTICLVLDYFCYLNSLQRDEAVTLKTLIDMVFNKSSFRRTSINETIVQTAIINMNMMGLLYEVEDGYYAITDQGKIAYVNQTYHALAANLYQAKASRNLSIIAVVVAIAGIFLSIILQIN